MTPPILLKKKTSNPLRFRWLHTKPSHTVAHPGSKSPREIHVNSAKRKTETKGYLSKKDPFAERLVRRRATTRLTCPAGISHTASKLPRQPAAFNSMQVLRATECFTKVKRINLVRFTCLHYAITLNLQSVTIRTAPRTRSGLNLHYWGPNRVKSWSRLETRE